MESWRFLGPKRVLRNLMRSAEPGSRCLWMPALGRWCGVETGSALHGQLAALGARVEREPRECASAQANTCVNLFCVHIFICRLIHVME